MIILFPSYPFDGNRIDPGFEAEAEAAMRAGFQIALIDTELLTAEVPNFYRMPSEVGGPHRYLYRGWLLTPSHYEKMAVALRRQGGELITPLHHYLEAYDFPRWYLKLQGLTPKSLSFEGR